ncbi:FecR family protein [Nibrella saemangeumensis]|uniref:FecR family protein n=1 Tax=Nibrella saemangeumensis TaxID=1084526 RepID=A0ABP8NHI9_9BACT
MKNYQQYTVEDFIRDEDFQQWVQGRSTQESFWLAFVQNHPEKRAMIRQAEQFIRAVSVAPERISEAEIRREVEQFIETASGLTTRRPPAPEKPSEEANIPLFRLGLRWGMAAAACLLAVLAVGGYFYTATPAQPKASLPVAAASQLVETINDTRDPLRIVLTDSSEVLLSPRSRIRYPSVFSEQSRVVYLTGEGVFSVKRQNRPFMVYTGEMVTRVLGTRFVVRAFDLDKKISVQVLSGKVSVYKHKPQQTPANKEVNGLILTANQAAIFEKNVGHLTKTLVANPSLVETSSRESDFVYDEVSLPAILRELETSYRIPIQFDEQSFAACKVTAALTSESLYEKLDLLCKSVSASYEITDGQIIISGRGCK